MKNEPVIFRLDELPDRACPTYQVLAGGDVSTAVAGDFEHLVRTVADLPADSVSVALRFLYRPKTENKNPQERLSIFLAGCSRKIETLTALSLLLKIGRASCRERV